MKHFINACKKRGNDDLCFLLCMEAAHVKLHDYRASKGRAKESGGKVEQYRRRWKWGGYERRETMLNVEVSNIKEGIAAEGKVKGREVGRKDGGKEDKR